MTKIDLINALGIEDITIRNMYKTKTKTKILYRLLMGFSDSIVPYLANDDNFNNIVPLDRGEFRDIIKSNIDKIEYNCIKKNGGLYEQKIHSNSTKAKRISKCSKAKKRKQRV